MRVALVHDAYDPVVLGNVGGEDNLVQLELKLLELHGIEVFPLIRSLSGAERKKWQIQIAVTGKGISPLEELDDWKPDVIHTNNLSLISGYDWMKSSPFPVVSSFHNYRPFCSISIAWRDGEICFACRDKGPSQALKNACGGPKGMVNALRTNAFQRGYPELNYPQSLIFTSRRMAQAYKPLLTSAQNFAIINNPTRDISQEIGKISISDKREGFLFAGRLSREKGILNLLENWPKNEKLFIAGKGVELEQVLQEIRTKENIKYIGTYDPNDFSIYQRYEALFFPSSWLEGSPLTVTEAIASGLPVICTSFSSATEIVSDTKSGIIVEGLLSEEGIKAGIQKLRKNWHTFHENGMRARLSNLSPDSWALNLLDVFKKSIAS